MLWDFFDLTGVTDAKGSSFKYEYDNHHNVTKGTSAEKRVLYYQYDDKGNVVKSAAVSAGDETAGTWLTRTMTENQNHMRTVKDARGCQVTYDWDTGKDPLDSVKDARNILWTQGRKLSAISNGSNGKSIRYYYDHTGARVKKTVNGVTTGYRMAGSLLISERTDGTTLWYQYDSAANLVALMIGTERYNYIRNAQNDIIGLIDSTGKRVVSYKYDSWGKVVSITGTLAATVGQKNPFRYRGYYFDAESGMYYLQSRYYDPEIRRFISADDYGLLSASNTVYDKNLYAYGDGNPIIRLDASGRIWETIFDIVSLGDSIWQTVMEPADPWNWIGLVGDTIDLIPVVTGVGEAVRAVKTIDRIDTAADTVSTVRKGWKVGDDITTVTKAGKSPAWSTVKSRYWKNEAYYRPDQYSLRNLPRMRAGRAPLVQSQKGKYYPMELHHKIPRRNGGGHHYSNLMQLPPWEHARIDRYRHFKE